MFSGVRGCVGVRACRAVGARLLCRLQVISYLRYHRTSVPPQSYEFFLELPNNNAFIFNEISKYFSIHSLVEKHRKLESWKVDI